MEKWTQEELEKLKMIYPTGSKSEIMTHFPDRHWRRIRLKAKKLGLKIGHRRDDYWTDEEIKFLENNYRAMTDKEISKYIERDAKAIQYKRVEIGLKKRKNDNFSSSLPELTEVEKAYLAGLLDADGSISLFKYKINQNEKISSRVSVAVSITSANKEFTEEINKMVGGVAKRRSDVHYETVIAKQIDILTFLQNLLPYLRLKKKQAQIMINYCKDRIETRRQKGDNAPYSEKSFKLAKQIKKLNEIRMEDRKWK